MARKQSHKTEKNFQSKSAEAGLIEKTKGLKSWIGLNWIGMDRTGKNRKEQDRIDKTGLDRQDMTRLDRT